MEESIILCAHCGKKLSSFSHLHKCRKYSILSFLKFKLIHSKFFKRFNRLKQSLNERLETFRYKRALHHLSKFDKIRRKTNNALLHSLAILSNKVYTWENRVRAPDLIPHIQSIKNKNIKQ